MMGLLFCAIFLPHDQDMIENTWKWARANGKIITHAISGGEFVDIDVEHLKKVYNETGSRMSQEAGTHFEDISS